MRRTIAAIALTLALTNGTPSLAGDGPDNVAQHLPMATVLTLKAAGAPGGEAWGVLGLTSLSAYTIAALSTYTLKTIISERRPDHSDCRSFPSGHATMAFAGATVLRHEWGHLSPWVTVGGYGVATLVALDRVRRDRHYLHDACAGAAVGIAATELTYYLRQRFFPDSGIAITVTPASLTLVCRL